RNFCGYGGGHVYRVGPRMVAHALNSGHCRRRPARAGCEGAVRPGMRPESQFGNAASPEPNPGGTTTLVRADESLSREDTPDLHPQLRAQLKELRLRTDTATPDLAMLLRLVSSHY